MCCSFFNPSILTECLNNKPVNVYINDRVPNTLSPLENLLAPAAVNYSLFQCSLRSMNYIDISKNQKELFAKIF